MTTAIAFLLAATFVISVGGLALLIWALANDQFTLGEGASRTIFADGEVGRIEDPGLTGSDRAEMQRARTDDAVTEPGEGEESASYHRDLAARREADASTRTPVLWWLLSSLFWLALASLLGVVASVKLHLPEWLVQDAALTFGRVRPAHLNAAAYGWSSMAGVAVGLWMIPRLFKTPLVGGSWATLGAVVWNLGVFAGIAALLAGQSDGMEWLEFPWQVDVLLVAGGAFAAVPLILTLIQRRVQHLYVSAWYLIGALIWFPMLFLTGNLPNLFSGVEQSMLNWWYAHNVLGLWLTPLGLAAAYYMIPKIVGAPIYSYGLSLIGFWALALFYSQVGLHHLIGGPVPTWAVTLSIVHSVMMVIPVLAVAVNHHMTVARHWRLLLISPTLRFVTVGAMLYTAASVQGSLESLRAVNAVTHFTHYTVAHAHLGAYGFFSFVMFGSVYFILPRVTGREWPFPRAISAHFWLVFGGFVVYFWPLTIGGWLQGLAMLDADRPFMDSVVLTQPWLVARSVGGTLMTAGHLVFVVHTALAVATRSGTRREGATLFRRLGDAT
ncbi:MAG: cbb3-type cytochrome c oxidase subunit I [Pseudomonadales bacterium]|jgi:cytochrome c oxidase cbb3-type subunit 1|nr:cbb3-type cytochrome c oxidase subunit I [Pseudomonadales bacterium]